MIPDEIEVAPGVFTSANGIFINDKGEYGIRHNGVEITMSEAEFREIIEVGQGVLSGNVEPMTSEPMEAI